MQNLIKIQEELKSLPTQAVMAYVEGKGSVVPPYLALTELNRRKQIQKSAQAQQPQQNPTVKDQVQQQAGLMALQNQREMMPQGMPPQMNEPNEDGVVMAAQGGYMGMPSQPSPMYQPQGIMQLPTPGMFQQQNFAGGGIVAFNGEEGSAVNYIDPDEERKKRQTEMYTRLREENKARNAKPYLAEDFRADAERFFDPIAAFFTMRDAKELEKAKRLQTADSPKDYDIYDPKAVVKEEVKPAVVPPSAVAPARPPVARNDGIAATRVPPKDIYTQEAENLEKLKQRFGVKDNSTSESDRMIADLRKRLDEQRGQQGIEALAAAMARGSKGMKSYEALGGFGEGYFAKTGEQRKLNNEQDQAFANLQISREKEDDARRRGDVKGVQDAVEKTRLADINLRNAESNRIQALKPSALKEQIELLEKNPQLYARMYPKENPLVVAAAKAYFENELQFKKDYPTVQDYLTAKGLSTNADAAGANAPVAPPQGAVDALRKDPKLSKEFDNKYGAGASKRILG